MWYQARAVLGVVAGCLTCLSACGISVDYDDTEYRCNRSGRCPDGFSCVEGMCVRGLADAAPDPIDARDDDDDFTMYRSQSDSVISIPDGYAPGIIDGVNFTQDCVIVDITVEIDITHEWRGDLVISLTSPEDTEIDLRDYDSDEDGDDVIGTYPTTLTPDESLDAFYGEGAVGVWLLQVADLDSDDIGVLNGWAVNLWCAF